MSIEGTQQRRSQLDSIPMLALALIPNPDHWLGHNLLLCGRSLSLRLCQLQCAVSRLGRGIRMRPWLRLRLTTAWVSGVVMDKAIDKVG